MCNQGFWSKYVFFLEIIFSIWLVFTRHFWVILKLFQGAFIIDNFACFAYAIVLTVYFFFAGITLLLGVGFVICGILVLLFFRGFVDDYIKSVSFLIVQTSNTKSQMLSNIFCHKTQAIMLKNMWIVYAIKRHKTCTPYMCCSSKY